MRGLVWILFFGIAFSLGLMQAHAQVVPKTSNEKKNFDLKELTQGFPKIIKKNPSGENSSSKRLNIELRQFDEVGYLQTLSNKTDSLLFAFFSNIFNIKSILSQAFAHIVFNFWSKL